MPKGLDGFEHEAEQQAKFFDKGGIAPHAALLRAVVHLLANDPAARARVLQAWADREFSARYERPLLVCAAMHREAISDPVHPLARSFFEGAPFEATILARVLSADSRVLAALRSRYVQTNEVTRAITWRLALPPAWATSERVALVDVGCSAGLNLVGERLDLAWVTEADEPIELQAPAQIVARVGLDRAPVDPSDPDEALWLRACLWPGQHERRARLDAAIDAAKGARDRQELELVALDADRMPSWIDAFSRRDASVRVLVCQTVFLSYLPPGIRARFVERMHRWLERNEGRALWVELEDAPKGSVSPAELRATFADHGVVATRAFGYSHYHPRVVHVDRDALRAIWAAAR